MLFGRIFINVETILGSIWHRFPLFFKHIFADGFCIDFLLIVHRFMNRCTLKKHCISRLKSRFSWNRDTKTNFKKDTDFTLKFPFILHVFSINLPYFFGIDLMMSFWTSFLWIWVAKRPRCGLAYGILGAQSAHVQPKLTKTSVRRALLGGSKSILRSSCGPLASFWLTFGAFLAICSSLMPTLLHVRHFRLSWLRILIKNGHLLRRRAIYRNFNSKRNFLQARCGILASGNLGKRTV